MYLWNLTPFIKFHKLLKGDEMLKLSRLYISHLISYIFPVVQSVGAAEYTDCISAEE